MLLLAVAFGVMSVIIAGGFVEWAYWALRESAIQTGLGHIQITRGGYRQAGMADPHRFLLPEDGAAMVQLRSLPEVRDVAPRLLFAGLISKGETTVSFVGEGVDPVPERHVSRLLGVTRGADLSPDARDEIVLGQILARSIGADVGDRVVLLVRTPSGGINALELRVRGFVSREIRAYDSSIVRMNLSTAQALTRMAGSHVWVLALDRTENTDLVAQRIGQMLVSGSAQGDFEVRTWQALSDYYRSAVALFSRQVLVVEVIIAAIIVLSMSNSLVMSVLERTGEIGTMMAIGTRRRSVLRLFMAEGFLIGVAGAVLGGLAGVLLAKVISAVGIPMPPPPGREVGYRAQILVTPALVAGAMMLALVCAVLASLYPSLKAARLQIVEALRRNR